MTARLRWSTAPFLGPLEPLLLRCRWPKWSPCTLCQMCAGSNAAAKLSIFSNPIVGAQYRWAANFPLFASLGSGNFFKVGNGRSEAKGSGERILTATANVANVISALIIFNNPNYNPLSWHMAICVPFPLSLWCSISTSANFGGGWRYPSPRLLHRHHRNFECHDRTQHHRICLQDDYDWS